MSCLVRPHLRFLAFSSRLETRDSRLVCHASHVSRYWSILLLQLLDPDSALQPSDHWRWSGRHASGGQAGPCTCTVLCKVVTRFLRRDSLASNLQLVPEAGNGAALPPDCGQKETLFLILALPQNDGNEMHRLPPPRRARGPRRACWATEEGTLCAQQITGVALGNRGPWPVPTVNRNPTTRKGSIHLGPKSHQPEAWRSMWM